jgi:hypothetical protein
MSENLIFQLVELAVNLAQTQLDSGNAERALVAVVGKAIEAYEDHTGEPINLSLIRAEARL